MAVIAIASREHNFEFYCTEHREARCTCTQLRNNVSIPEAQCDDAEEHSLKKLDAMSCKNLQVLTVHHNPSSEANSVLKNKTFPSVCEKFVILDDGLGTRQFPDSQVM